MKTNATLLIIFLLAAFSTGIAQTTYTVKKNTDYPANCTDCTFNIASDATITISKEGTCNNCTFNGGTIVVANTITCQPCTFSGNTITINDKAAIKPNSKTTSFTNVKLTANGASSINANTPVSIAGSVFTFNGTSFFNNNGGQLDLSKSTLNFFGNSYFNANAGPVNLKDGSKLVAGSGLVGSMAYIKMNGAVLNIYDNASSIFLANTNNYYYNWGSYNAVNNGKSYATTYPTDASKLNCGGVGQNTCGMWNAPTVYGPAGFTTTGVAAISAALPVVLTSFTASSSNNDVLLAWTTSQEINAAYFTVERSSNNAIWEKIGTVNATGNATVQSRYTFTDAATLQGIAYYRLALVDEDGQKVYSAIKAVQGSIIKEISFYPNPATDKVNVAVTGNNTAVTVQLMSQAGQVLQERKAGNAATVVSFDVQQYAKGMYVLRVAAANGVSQTSKLMIVR